MTGLSSVSRRAGALVLATEVAVLFFFSLAAFGLRLLDRGVVVGVLVVGVVLLVTAAGTLGRPFGHALAWVLQVALVALGFLAPLMFVVGGIFAALWVYAVVGGRRAERAAAAASGVSSSDETDLT